MRRQPHTHAPRTLSRRPTEIYCRRDNRVYSVCPHVAAGAPCPCLHELETADALFEPAPVDEEPEN